MLALLGQKSTPKRAEIANPDDSSADSDPDEDDADAEGDNDSDASDSDSEEEDNLNLKEGVDTLQSSNRLDIPVVTDIPVVSQLAKAQSKTAKMGVKQDKYNDTSTKFDDKFTKRSKDVKEMMESADRDVETHFVDNPFIRVRERASQKNMAGKQNIGAKELAEEDAEGQDIVMMKEGGKFMIKDLEQLDLDKHNAKKRRNVARQTRDVEDSDTDEEDL